MTQWLFYFVLHFVLRFALFYIVTYLFMFQVTRGSVPISSSMNIMQNIMQYYEQKQGVIMNFKKSHFVPILSKTHVSYGKIFLSLGVLRLDVKDALKTRFILTKKSLFHITCSSALSSPVVTKWDLSSKAPATGLIGALFNKEQFDKRFIFVSSQTKGRALVSRFEPIKKTDGIHFLLLKTEKNLLLGATIMWHNGNKQDYEFSNIRLKQKIPEFFFKAQDKKLTCAKELDRVSALKKLSHHHKDKFL